jgi:mannose-6-phosphate isomerase
MREVLYPLIFEPIFKERVWGGRKLAELYGKPLPPGAPVGESWEISDRLGDVSKIANGPLAGKDLSWLMAGHGAELLGDADSPNERFPLLVKILDAREALSLQVHPPAVRAAELGGEPKTEMWYIADAAPGAGLYAGLKRGVTRAEFERKLEAGSVAECFHRLGVQAGDALFLPSGRVHALGGGLVVFEIQQNSDTTYRVFDWNRLGLEGSPRELHVPQSLASIDFNDFEPVLAPGSFAAAGPARVRPLVSDRLFTVEAWQIDAGAPLWLAGGRMHILGVVSGALSVRDGQICLSLNAGHFCLIPASLVGVELRTGTAATFLRAEAGNSLAGAQWS